MSLNYHVIGKRIRNYRQQKNLSQKSVAEKIAKSATYISYIKSGLKRPSLDTLVDLANLLGVTVGMLLGETQKHTQLTVEAEYQQVLHDCTDQEKKILIEIARMLKEAFHSHQCP